MDTKALAKSKRAHSQHHSKKHHPHVTSKTPVGGSGGASNGKKPSEKQVTEKPDQSQGSNALPSNWDRYEDEYDLVSEDSSRIHTIQAGDDVVPKSKGADYCHLISEAKSQSQADISSQGFPSFDDVLTDFSQGVGSLLSVRGKGILSWTGDDNFVVEDRATASNEASFLSLNLHLLAEQLAKVDLSQRLFIEPDFLPSELCTEELKTNFSQEPDKVQAEFQNERMEKISDYSSTYSYHDRDKLEDQVNQFVSTDRKSDSHSLSTSSNYGLKATNQIKDELNQSRRTGESTVQYYREQLDGTSVADPKQKSSGIEAAAAEAELDILLNSFSETNFLDSSAVTNNSFSIQQETLSRFEGVSSSKQNAAQPFRKVPDSWTPASVATNFAVDDLLKETSFSGTFPVRQQENSTSVSGGTPLIHLAAVQPSRNGPGSSKSASIAASFDDALDDLLKETAEPTNHKGTSQSREVIATHLSTLSSSSGSVSKSKVLDDFDSWFDKIDGP